MAETLILQNWVRDPHPFFLFLRNLQLILQIACDNMKNSELENLLKNTDKAHNFHYFQTCNFYELWLKKLKPQYIVRNFDYFSV